MKYILLMILLVDQQTCIFEDKILSKIILIIFNIFNMATRAKYTRVRQEDNKEDKPDTDILMRFSPSYGKNVFIQVDMLAEVLHYSLGRENPLLLSRLLIGLWTEHFGLLKC